MIIVGIDPGSRALGYGVIETQEKKFKYIDSGVFRYDKEKNFFNRLNLIHSHGQELALRYQPDFIGVESLIYVKSVPSLAKLARQEVQYSEPSVKIISIKFMNILRIKLNQVFRVLVIVLKREFKRQFN